MKLLPENIEEKKKAALRYNIAFGVAGLVLMAASGFVDISSLTWGRVIHYICFILGAVLSIIGFAFWVVLFKIHLKQNIENNQGRNDEPENE